jgi:excisionase family DNA binding protein
METTPERPRHQRETLTVVEAAEILGISRSSAFQAASNGELPVIRIGKRLLVPRIALERMLDSSNKSSVRQLGVSEDMGAAR